MGISSGTLRYVLSVDEAVRLTSGSATARAHALYALRRRLAEHGISTVATSFEVYDPHEKLLHLWRTSISLPVGSSQEDYEEAMFGALDLLVGDFSDFVLEGKRGTWFKDGYPAVVARPMGVGCFAFGLMVNRDDDLFLEPYIKIALKPDGCISLDKVFVQLSRQLMGGYRESIVRFCLDFLQDTVKEYASVNGVVVKSQSWVHEREQWERLAQDFAGARAERSQYLRGERASTG